jgi:uncharacterized protein YcfJ
MDLTKMSNQVVSQMIGSEEISSSISKKMFDKINKVGVGAVLAVVLSSAVGMAHAGDDHKSLGATVGLAGLVGILNDGSRPPDVPLDCNVQGTNGYKVGGAGVAGAYVGNQMGGGTGKTLLTVAGGYLAATAVQSAENNRIRNECLRDQANRQQAAYNNGGNYQQYPQNNGYNNGYQNNNYHQQQASANAYNQRPQAAYSQYPTSNISALPQEMVLYAVENQQGFVSYISVSQSPGVSALKGQRGGQDPYSNRNVQSDMEQTMQKMVNSYQALEAQSNNYLSVANGRSAQGEQVIGGGRDYVEQENVRLQRAMSQYSKDRAFFAQTADNAAMSGYNLSAYSNALNYLAAPPSLQVAFGGKNINRFSTLKSTFANR